MERVTISPLILFAAALAMAAAAGRVGAGEWAPPVVPATVRDDRAKEQTRTEDWKFSVGASGTLLYSDNIGLAPPGLERSDFALGVSVPLRLRHDGPHLKFVGQYTPTFYQYARSSEFNDVQNNLTSLLSLEAVDNFFFVDASANVYQSYISPTGPRPESGASITPNRTQQTTLGLSPYVRRETGQGWTYLIRNDNFWNTYSASELGSGSTNSLSADVKSPPARLRYGADYLYLLTRNEGPGVPSGSFYQQVGRFRPILTATPRLRVSARLGYETNDYSTDKYSGAVYGAGAEWAPNPRTKLDGFIEHRFFGAGYRLDLGHRSRFTSWKLGGLRGTYTAQDQALTLRPGTTAEILDDAFRTRIPDPAERDEAIRRIMEQAGVPPTLTQPYSFATNQIYLTQQWTGSVAWLGKRNTVELALLWQENKPLTPAGTGVPGNTFNLFRQRGATLSFSHRLTPLSAVTLGGSRIYSQSPNAQSGGPDQDSVQDTVRISLTRQLGPASDGSIGLRWTTVDSEVDPYRELGIFVALSHRF